MFNINLKRADKINQFKENNENNAPLVKYSRIYIIRQLRACGWGLNIQLNINEIWKKKKNMMNLMLWHFWLIRW